MKNKLVEISQLPIGTQFTLHVDAIPTRSDGSGTTKFPLEAGCLLEVCKINPKSIGVRVLKYPCGAVDVVDPQTWHVCFPKDFKVCIPA